jgi:type IV pilus assembly protein PilA
MISSLKKGFTIMELMTVIAIIAILAAIVIPNLALFKETLTDDKNLKNNIQIEQTTDLNKKNEDRKL